MKERRRSALPPPRADFMDDNSTSATDEMHYNHSMLDLIGNTPLIRLNRVTSGLQPLILAKMEIFNPGGSVKDRIGPAMIEYCEKRGLLRPSGTIVEPTSDNTGHGLAIAAAIKGYHCIFVMTDKASEEKRGLFEPTVLRWSSAPAASPMIRRNTIKMWLIDWLMRFLVPVVPINTPILPILPPIMPPPVLKYGAIQPGASPLLWQVLAPAAPSPVRAVTSKSRAHRSRLSVPTHLVLSTQVILLAPTRSRASVWRFSRITMMLRWSMR